MSVVGIRISRAAPVVGYWVSRWLGSGYVIGWVCRRLGTGYAGGRICR